MSNATDLQLVLDNRCNVSSETTKIVTVSGVQTTYTELSPEGGAGVANSTINWQNIITPSLSNTLLSRNIRMRYTVACSATQLPPFYNPANPCVAGSCALRSFPLQSICSNISLALNGSTTTLASRNILSAIQRTCPREWLEEQGTECPCQPDDSACLVVDGLPITGSFVWGAAYPGAGAWSAPIQMYSGSTPLNLWAQYVGAGAQPAVGTYTQCLVYNTNVLTAGAGTQIVQTGRLALTAYFIQSELVNGALGPLVYLNQSSSTSSNVLSGYFNSDKATRGSFMPTSVNLLTQTVTFDVSESLLISPLTIFDTENFLSNINTLNLTLNFSNTNDMVVFGAGAVVPAGFTVAISNPQLELTYLQVENSVVSIPRLTSYPYTNIVYFQQSIGQLMGSAVLNDGINVVGNTVRLQSMPERIYVFVRPTINTYRNSTVGSASFADAFLTMPVKPNINVSLGNRTGLFSSASRQTLYRMCKKNNYNGSYAEWLMSGSILVIDPVEDFGLNISAGDALPGESASVNFSISGNWSNANYVQAYAQANAVEIADVTLELVTVVCYSGVVSLTPDNCIMSIGDLSEAEVNSLIGNAPKDGTMISSEALTPTIEGKGLYVKRKNLMSHTAKGATRGGAVSGGMVVGAGVRRK